MLAAALMLPPMLIGGSELLAGVELAALLHAARAKVITTPAVTAIQR
jgi:hypothetical protein